MLTKEISEVEKGCGSYLGTDKKVSDICCSKDLCPICQAKLSTLKSAQAKFKQRITIKDNSKTNCSRCGKKKNGRYLGWCPECCEEDSNNVADTSVEGKDLDYVLAYWESRCDTLTKCLNEAQAKFDKFVEDLKKRVECYKEKVNNHLTKQEIIKFILMEIDELSSKQEGKEC